MAVVLQRVPDEVLPGAQAVLTEWSRRGESRLTRLRNAAQAYETAPACYCPGQPLPCHFGAITVGAALATGAVDGGGP